MKHLDQGRGNHSGPSGRLYRKSNRKPDCLHPWFGGTPADIFAVLKCRFDCMLQNEAFFFRLAGGADLTLGQAAFERTSQNRDS